MLKQKTFNYITLILAILTIFMAISTVRNNSNRFYTVIMLLITLFFYFISKKYNNNILNLKNEDKQILEKLEYTIKHKNEEKFIEDRENKINVKR